MANHSSDYAVNQSYGEAPPTLDYLDFLMLVPVSDDFLKIVSISLFLSCTDSRT